MWRLVGSAALLLCVRQALTCNPRRWDAALNLDGLLLLLLGLRGSSSTVLLALLLLLLAGCLGLLCGGLVGWDARCWLALQYNNRQQG